MADETTLRDDEIGTAVAEEDPSVSADADGTDTGDSDTMDGDTDDTDSDADEDDA